MAQIRIENVLISLILFVGMITSIVSFESALSTDYNFTTKDVQRVQYKNINGVNGTSYDKNATISEHFQNLLIGKGIASVESSVYGIAAGGGIIDIIGSLLSGGVGVLKILVGVITAPSEIMYIIFAFYTDVMPAILLTTLIDILSLAIIFVIIKKATGGDI